mgnify:FL=1
MPPLLLRALPYIVVVALFSLAVCRLYNLAYENGASSIQTQWNAEKLKHSEEMDALEKQMVALERDHQKENERITHELAQANQIHAVSLAANRSDYDKRLQLASKRYGVYQAIGVSSSSECRGLSSHAIELDRTLEEGRFLVRELRDTLELRDSQVKSLGSQILNDRRVISDARTD